MRPMDVTPEVTEALAEARDAIKHMGTDRPERLSNLYADYAAKLVAAFNTLDNVGLFAVVDEVNDYAPAEEILAEAAAMSLAEAGHQGVPLDYRSRYVRYPQN